MPTKSSNVISPRALSSVLVYAVACSIASGSLLALLHSEVPSSVQRTLTFRERVAYQRAIEEVYWRHRIWPKELSDPKPPLDGIISQSELETKVADYLSKSQLVEQYLQRPITTEQLQGEMDRMAQETKQADVLKEVFAALGNDPFVIAECLARPLVSERVIINLYPPEQYEELLEPSRAGAENGLHVIAAAGASYTLPTISDVPDACTDNTWTATIAANAPTGRSFHTAVWTGSEMIIWGGGPFGGNSVNTGGKYNPSTNSWTATSTTNAPTGRARHTAIWTGSEMIVWGGSYGSGPPTYLNTGGRYNPVTNAWTATSTINAPTARTVHTAVWTGSRMIVWGGFFYDGTGHFLNTGGSYDPGSNSWIPTSTANTPIGRDQHTAIWSGSEMIIWGGQVGNSYLDNGGRYNPSTNSWTAISTTNAPFARAQQTAIWTGTEMIVWGGRDVPGNYLNSGGRYNASNNGWSATNPIGAPNGRLFHTAVWTGSRMIVWGGFDMSGNFLNTGSRYNPSTNSWTTTSITNAPPHREAHTAVWNGSQMVVWGGYNGLDLNTGGRYCAPTATPTITPCIPPVVTTNAASRVASYSATLNGTVNPEGCNTTVHFQYGTTTSYGSTTASQTKTGNTYQNVTANINGLSASTTYHFRIVATNSSGTRYGSDRIFTTLSATGPPVAITNSATHVTSSSATLNGSVDPHGLTTNVHFQYGTTTSYGHTTANQSKTGNVYQNVAANISGLTSHTTYHFRIVATNSGGTRYGSDRTLTTTP